MARVKRAGSLEIPGGVQLRTFQRTDVSALVDVWNHSLSVDPIDLVRFVKQVLCDPNFDSEGLQIAAHGSDVVGFCLAVERKLPLAGADLEPTEGWITAMGVRPDWQGVGVGTALLDAAEAFLRVRGKVNVHIAPYAPNYFWPGVDQEAYPVAGGWLTRRGYQERYVAAAMDKSLIGFAYPDDVRAVEAMRVKEGYTFQHLAPELVHDVVRFAGEHFSADWARAVRESIVQDARWDQFLVALHPEQTVVGFAMFGGYGGTLERFGPFGVDARERGKGLGKVLLYRTLAAMSARGLHGAWFLWTGEQTPAGLLYHRAGFHITRRFHVLHKKLTVEGGSDDA